MKISKRGKIILLLSCALIIILTAWFTIRYLSTPKVDLVSILPESPLGYISVKNLNDIISAIEDTEFGVKLKTLPILQTIKSNPTWRQLRYQKALWEYEMRGRLDRNVLKDFADKEAILSVYNRNPFAFLLISQVGASGKMQVSATEAQDVIDSRYKMVKERYQDIETITVVGFPEEFTYAFIGKIGLLSNDKTLIQDAIDIYKKRKTGFVKQDYGGLLQRQDKSNSSSFYFDLSRYPFTWFEGRPENLPFGTVFKVSIRKLLNLKDIFKGVKIWYFNNKYGDGKVVSEHHFVVSNINPPLKKVGEFYDPPQPASRQILSMTPADSALLFSAEGIELVALWDICHKFFGVELMYRDSRTELEKYLGKRINFIMLSSSNDEVRLVPAMAFLIPITNVPAVEESLLELGNSIRISGKNLKFTGREVYNGVNINLAELPLGFMFSVKGGYTIIDGYLVIGTTISIIQKIIDTAASQQKPLNPMDYHLYLNPESTGYLFIHPPTLVPELQRIASFYALIAGISKNRQGSQIASQISKNLYPLAALGGIGANFDLHEDQGIAEVTIW
ncbi:hypothetical protein FJZ31_21690 [Candidatus Poribacteria bacterium]|nr:hypothetical protein [Candidatus Poribacteria bacterium]